LLKTIRKNLPVLKNKTKQKTKREKKNLPVNGVDAVDSAVGLCSLLKSTPRDMKPCTQENPTAYSVWL
jgi:hypothetical protein